MFLLLTLGLPFVVGILLRRRRAVALVGVAWLGVVLYLFADGSYDNLTEDTPETIWMMSIMWVLFPALAATSLWLGAPGDDGSCSEEASRNEISGCLFATAAQPVSSDD